MLVLSKMYTLYKFLPIWTSFLIKFLVCISSKVYHLIFQVRAKLLNKVIDFCFWPIDASRNEYLRAAEVHCGQNKKHPSFIHSCDWRWPLGRDDSKIARAPINHFAKVRCQFTTQTCLHIGLAHKMKLISCIVDSYFFLWTYYVRI